MRVFYLLVSSAHTQKMHVKSWLELLTRATSKRLHLPAVTGHAKGVVWAESGFLRLDGRQPASRGHVDLQCFCEAVCVRPKPKMNRLGWLGRHTAWRGIE